MTNVDVYVGRGFSPGKLGKQNFILAVADSQTSLNKEGKIVPYQTNVQKIVNIGPYLVASAGKITHFWQLCRELYQSNRERAISDVEELADRVVGSMQGISKLEPTVDCIVAGQDKEGILRAIAVDLRKLTDYTNKDDDSNTEWIKRVALRTGNAPIEEDYLPQPGNDALPMNLDRAQAIAYKNAMRAARHAGVNDKLQVAIAQKAGKDYSVKLYYPTATSFVDERLLIDYVNRNAEDAKMRFIGPISRNSKEVQERFIDALMDLDKRYVSQIDYMRKTSADLFGGENKLVEEEIDIAEVLRKIKGDDPQMISNSTNASGMTIIRGSEPLRKLVTSLS